MSTRKAVVCKQRKIRPSALPCDESPVPNPTASVTVTHYCQQSQPAYQYVIISWWLSFSDFWYRSLAPSASASAPAITYLVEVGQGGQLNYDPESLFASVLDDIVFHFNPKNHTVTQSSFLDPCKKLRRHIPLHRRYIVVHFHTLLYCYALLHR